MAICPIIVKRSSVRPVIIRGLILQIFMFKFKTPLLAATVGLSLLCLNTGAHAGIINGNFDNGFDGWQTIGTTVTGRGEAVAEDSGASQSELEDFLGLSAGKLDYPESSFKTDVGSGFFQTFTGNAGETVSFDYASFFTVIPDGTVINDLNNDFTFYVFDGEVNFLNSYFGDLDNGNPRSGTKSFVLGSSGPHTIGFGATNTSFAFSPTPGNNFPSALQVDNVQVTGDGPQVAPVPELSSGMLLMLSMGALMMACAFQKNRAAKAASQL